MKVRKSPANIPIFAALYQQNQVSKLAVWLDFIRSRMFVIQVVIGVILVMILLFSVLKYLHSYTHHGEEISVPDLHGMNKADLDAIMEERQLRYVILDSVYSDADDKGTVIGQNPSALSKVKINRTIYLTISAMQPPSVKLPLLVDKSLRQAKSIIENVGLVLGELQYRPDQCLNCVLAQIVKGREIKKDTSFPKGTRVNLVLGGGLSDEKILVPFLIGLTKEEAIEKLKSYYLNISGVNFDDSVFDRQDSLEARVYEQNPPYGAQSWVQLGSSVDIYLTTMENKIDINHVELDSLPLHPHLQDSNE